MTETIWAVSDGGAGFVAQALGLAEAISRVAPCKVENKTFNLRAPWRQMPARFLAGPYFGLPFSAARSGGSSVEPPWPRVLIACGRISVPVALAVKRLSGGETYTVQAQNPRVPLDFFDLVVPPLHDMIDGANVIPIVGSLNRLSPVVLASARAKFEARYARLPSPRVAVLIGGNAKHSQLARLTTDHIGRLLLTLTRETGAGLMVTTSRRTPPEEARHLATLLAESSADVWDGVSDNPYFGMLAMAEYIIVTEDSVNMATEAASTGRPVYTIPLSGQGKKMMRFHSSLRGYGAARPFEGRLDNFSYEPLRETDRVAEEICKRAKLAS